MDLYRKERGGEIRSHNDTLSAAVARLKHTKNVGHKKGQKSRSKVQSSPIHSDQSDSGTS